MRCCHSWDASHGWIVGCEGPNFFCKSLLPANLSWLQSSSCIGCVFGAGISEHHPSHFLGLVFSSELLRSVTLPPSENIPVFKVA
ncbi:hypothetical protein NC651_003047 [Populus alba x Populus x berolinensis]|nr:hypothetical protein NC651_003047 [Populus alba x Populus x berolinensis]